MPKIDQRPATNSRSSAATQSWTFLPDAANPGGRKRKEEILEKIDENTGRKVAVTYEDWNCNLGPNRFMRILTFKNGVLVDIKTVGYGN